MLAVVSATGLTHWESHPKGPPAVCRWERVLGLFGLSSQLDLPCNRIQPGSQSQQQHFSPSSRAGDVNSRPSRPTSSQQSVLGCLLQSSHMEGPTTISRQTVPIALSLFSRARTPLLGRRRDELELRLREYPLRSPTKNGMDDSNLRTRPPLSSRGALGGLYTVSARGVSASFPRPENRLSPLDAGTPICGSATSSRFSHGLNIE